jgi:NAD(P)-dependent dehydrogenase (short-subunit alcohol dehydrogenase family)
MPDSAARRPAGGSCCLSSTGRNAAAMGLGMTQPTTYGRLAGKVAIVTGAASGIGRAIAVAFADAGARVVASTAHNAAGLMNTQSLAPAGSMVTFMANAAAAQDVEALVAFAEKSFGRLDILCNNAGIIASGLTEHISEQEWDEVMAVNLKSAFLGCKYAIPAMRRARGGSIINLGSVNSFVGTPSYSHYCASKGGVLMLTRTVALECAKDQIRVNAICPGMIDTPMNARFEQEVGGREKLEEICLSLQPLGLGRPEQVAAVAVFLASDESSLITGADIVVDGGFTAQ